MEHAQFGDTEIEVRHLRDHYEILKEKVGDTDKTGLAIEFEVCKNDTCILWYFIFFLRTCISLICFDTSF